MENSFRYGIVTDFEICFLFNSWARIIANQKPEFIYIRHPISRPFFENLNLSEQFIYSIRGCILIIKFLIFLALHPSLLKILPKIHRFRGWDSAKNDILKKYLQVERIYITTDSIVSSDFIENIGVPIFNKHAGDTRRIRGLLPAFWSLKLGIEPAITVHKVDEIIDNGEIILIEKIPMSNIGSLLGLYFIVYFILWPEIFNKINKRSYKKFDESYQHDLEPYYRSWPKLNEMSEFRVDCPISFARLRDIWKIFP